MINFSYKKEHLGNIYLEAIFDRVKDLRKYFLITIVVLSFIYMVFLTHVVFNSNLKGIYILTQDANKRMNFNSSLSKPLLHNDIYVSRSPILSLITHGKKYEDVT